MPWKETDPVTERIKFIEDWLSRKYSMTELCTKHEVSRKTGYKTIKRFKQGGVPALYDQSRAARGRPNATDDMMVKVVVGARRRHPNWGPKKLCALLKRQGYAPPAPSTIGGILKREGLVYARRRKPRPGSYFDGLSAQDAPNDVWAADFKGHFKLGDGKRCYPLTISDGFSRFLLRCQALEHPDELSSFEVFEAAFCEFGRPYVIRTDNGTPFSARNGISTLSVWWVELDMLPERIERGKPTQNGRHERIHRTLKQDAIQTEGPKRNFWEQQRVFDRFRREYNEERPHEALDQQPPASAYEPSARPYPIKPREPEYDSDVLVYRVRSTGAVVHKGEEIFLSKVLSGKPVGLTQEPDGRWRIEYGSLFLGTLSKTGHLTRGYKHRERPRRKQDEIPTPAQH